MFLVPASLSGLVIRHDIGEGSYAELAEQSVFSGLVQIEVGCCFSARYGSGYLIGNGWLLTAAHVLWGASPSMVSVDFDGSSYQAASVHFAPGWSGAPLVGLEQGADLALVQLSEPLQPTVPTTLVSTSSLGRVGVMLGSGRSGNGIVGANRSPKVLGAMNMVDREISVPGGRFLVTDFDDGSVSRNSLEGATVSRVYYDAGFTGPLLSEVVLDVAPGASSAFPMGLPGAESFFPGLADEFLEGTTASGDSGGPLMVWNPETAGWELAGVTSWGVNPLLPSGFAKSDSRYGDLSVFTEVSAHADWIAATVPESSTFILFLTAAGISFGWRRCRA